MNFISELLKLYTAAKKSTVTTIFGVIPELGAGLWTLDHFQLGCGITACSILNVAS